jgi:hypothetical protein
MRFIFPWWDMNMHNFLYGIRIWKFRAMGCEFEHFPDPITGKHCIHIPSQEKCFINIPSQEKVFFIYIPSREMIIIIHVPSRESIRFISHLRKMFKFTTHRAKFSYSYPIQEIVHVHIPSRENKTHHKSANINCCIMKKTFSCDGIFIKHFSCDGIWIQCFPVMGYEYMYNFYPWWEVWILLFLCANTFSCHGICPIIYSYISIHYSRIPLFKRLKNWNCFYYYFKLNNRNFIDSIFHFHYFWFLFFIVV